MAKKNKSFASCLLSPKTSLLLLGLMSGGVVIYPGVLEAQNRGGRAPQIAAEVAEIQALQTQLSQATAPAEQDKLRLKLADGYLKHGRPIEATRELTQWLKNNAKSPDREAVLQTLIKAYRQSNDWDAAASTSRAFVRDYPKSANTTKVFEGLVEITRYGQNTLSGEASALSDWLEAQPDAPGAAGRMLRLAKIQEQVGAVNDAVVTLQKFVAKYPQDVAANDAGWRAAFLMHDRQRRTGEALTAGTAHLTKYKRTSASNDWRLVGDWARSIDKTPEAISAYKKALEADPKNRDAAVQLIEILGRTNNTAELQRVASQLEKSFPGDTIGLDAQISLISAQINAGGKDLFPAAQALLDKRYRTLDVIGLMERAAGTNRAQLVSALQAEREKAKGWARGDVTIRLAQNLRASGKTREALTLIENEIKDNPLNRRDFTRAYLEWQIEDQINELQAKKRTKLEIDAVITKLAELVKPTAYFGEMRQGMEEAGQMLGRTKQKELSGQLRQAIESLQQNEIAVHVDTVHRESRRDLKRATDSLMVLLKESKDRPLVLQAVRGEAVWDIFDRLQQRPEEREKILGWYAAQAESRPTDLRLNNEVADIFRRAGKTDQAVKYFKRVADTPITPANAFVVGQAYGSLIDLYGYTLNKPAEVDALVQQIDKAGEIVPVTVRQELFRRLADVSARDAKGRDKQVEYYRRAADLGLSNVGWEAAKSLLMTLPTDDAIATGQKMLANPANDRYYPELALIVAHRMALGKRDLAGAVDILAAANEKRLTGFRSDWDNFNTFREVTSLALAVNDPKRITDAVARAALKDVKPLEPAKLDQLLNVASQWLTSQQLHEVAREIIRRAGAAGDRGTQLEMFSQVLSRTRSNDQWHWDRNMETIREEIARGNEGTASTMLRTLLKQSAGYNEEARASARTLLLNTYRRFGEDLLAVDDKSPIAPLLRGASYLRLGEEKTAWELYQGNSDVFASKIDEVPSEYVLFVANELATGSDTDRDNAEQLLRTWLARADKIAGLDPSVRAAVTLKLADVFYYARRFDVARAEYQGVIDKYPDSTQAIEARFRIGESLMYQKNYAEAGKVFEALRKAKDADTAIRGTFMTGVLQYTSGQRDEARDTFKTLLDLSPTEELASKALYQLALIYGDDNRFREMLDMLEAIGRLGREGKRWHTPGQNLTVMIHDPDMAIVQGATSVPVMVTTTTGDREIVTLTAGSAGKGIYLTDLATTLGSPKPGDGVLQLLGSDIISYDYPDDFKAKFKYVPPPQGNIRIASDATFAASAVKIVAEEKKSVVEKAAKENKIEREADQPKEFRSSGEIKPGNPIYTRVVDGDRSVNVGVNRLEIVARAASGDVVRAFINETSANTGAFEGMIKTAERPPEALASDSSLGKSPAFAADKDANTAWESQHDSGAGKWLAADLKDIYPVKSFAFTTPDAKNNAPVKYTIETSMNGQLWEPALSTEKGRIAHGLTLNYGPMRHSHYAWSKTKSQANNVKAPETLDEYMATVASGKITTIDAQSVSSFELPQVAADAEADVHSFVGYFYAPAAAKYTFIATGAKEYGAALVIDGRIIAANRNGFDKNNQVQADLSAGWHRLAFFMTTKGAADAQAKTRGLAFTLPNQKTPEPVQLVPSAGGGRDGAMPAPSTYTVPTAGTIKSEGATTTVSLPSVPARFVRINIEQYSGDYVAVSSLVVKGENDAVLLPSAVDIATIGDDDVLHVSPGDEITISYADAINTRTPGEARIMSGKLRATYFNASIAAIAYDVKSGAGGVSRTAKQLWRIDPGDRIVAQITDYDEDRTPEVDKITFKARTESGVEMTYEATETGPTTGVFTKEIDTGEGAGKLTVKTGEQIFLIYTDKLNTTPGSRTERIAQVEVVKPTDGSVAIVPTRVEAPPMAAKPTGGKSNAVTVKSGETEKTVEPKIVFLPPEPGKPARVVLAAPLTVEVYDPDAAKDSHSSVAVEVTTSAGAKLRIPLEIGDVGRTKPSGTQGGAIADGRFVGQALLVLGKPDEEGKETSGSVSVERARGLAGAWRYENSGEAGSVKAPIIRLTGGDTITVKYVDKLNTKGEARELSGEARMVTDATIANLDRGFESPITGIHVGDKLYARIEDGDRDTTSEQDEIEVQVTTDSGDKLNLKLKETLGHSGVFTAEVPTHQAAKPTADDSKLQVNFGDVVHMAYVDEANSMGTSPIERKIAVQVALGADAQLLAFTKQFGNEEMAVETQFKLAECYFELFKSHNSLKATAEAKAALEAGRAVLQTVRDNYRGSNYEARVLYLLGSFHQELKEYEKAIENFQTIIRAYASSSFAPDAQYKLAQCYEDKNEMEKAMEEYVRLAYTYPDNPLIAKCMVRLADYFYKSSRFVVAANICRQFLDQYGEHEWAPKIAFRMGQAYFKAGEAAAAEGGESKGGKGGATDAGKHFIAAAKAFDLLVERYVDSDLRADAMFWAGQGYHKGGDPASAYRRYRRCTWDFPDSDAARYARGQLTLPEMLAAAKEDSGNK